jgi:hypothetical protein
MTALEMQSVARRVEADARAQTQKLPLVAESGVQVGAHASNEWRPSGRTQKLAYG